MSRTGRSVPMFLLYFGLLAGGVFAGITLAASCSENLHPGTDRTRVCNNMDDGTFWVLVLVPPILLVLSQYIGWTRHRPVLVALVVAIPAAVLWTYLLLVANGDIGDTDIG